MVPSSSGDGDGAESRAVDVLAVGAHPDDIELGCGGTLALLARTGRRVGVLSLTRGERGTRGTLEERRREFDSAGKTLGAQVIDMLDFSDGALRTGEPEEDALIDKLREWRPEIVLAPPPRDRHPDHQRAHQLVMDACFYAGLARRGQGTPHRPAAVFSYLVHQPFEPSFVVDVGETWEVKMAALDVYESQLHQPERAGTGAKQRDDRMMPMTLVASREFRAAIEGRARHYGQLIGAEFGEPFFSDRPLSVSDPWLLRPRGQR